MRILWAAALAVLVTACDQGGNKKVEDVADKPLSANARPMLGVDPAKFQCATFLPEADLGAPPVEVVQKPIDQDALLVALTKHL